MFARLVKTLQCSYFAPRNAKRHSGKVWQFINPQGCGTVDRPTDRLCDPFLGEKLEQVAQGQSGAVVAGDGVGDSGSQTQEGFSHPCNVLHQNYIGAMGPFT